MAAWTDLTFAYGSKLTSTQMTQLDANLDALAEGANGAPKIQSAAIDTDAVTATKIGAGQVGSSEIAASAVKQSELSKAYNVSTAKSLAALERWTPSAGIRTMIGNSGWHYFQIYESGAWKGSVHCTGTIFWDSNALAVINIDGGSAHSIHYNTLS